MYCSDMDSIRWMTFPGFDMVRWWHWQFTQPKLSLGKQQLDERLTPSSYLTSQFYQQNYSLQQRLDILNVLTDAAKELSNVATTEISASKAKVEIVERPVGQVIRRSTQSKKPKLTTNQFRNHAKLFFFPLIVRFDSAL